MTRVFTVEEANRTLPLVSRIVEDIVRDYARWKEKVDAFEVEVARAPRGETGSEALRLEHEAQLLATEIERCVGELSDLGIEFKGFDIGLVDFPGERDGRPVYLCWRLGEARVDYWHDTETGFAGRQPLHGAAESAGAEQGDSGGSQ
ncbi:MAG: DUF2203 domain-containing protein [Gemmatimonadaceae bacterium]